MPALDKWSVLDQVGWDPHPGQLAVAESSARHRVVSAGRRFGKSDLGGHELLPHAYVAHSRRLQLLDKKMRMEYWIVGPEYCVDDQTEILTQQGWKRQHELEGNEIVLTQDPETGLAAWQQMTGISIFHGSRYVYESNFRGHSSVTTGEHRWLVEWGKRNLSYSSNAGVGKHNSIDLHGKQRGGWRFKTTETLGTASEKVYCAQPVVNLPTIQKYEDALVELVAWYWTEGQQWGKGIAISQNAGPHFDRIVSACHQMFGPSSDHMRSRSVQSTTPRWRILDNKAGIGQMGVALNGAAAECIRENCLGTEKVVTAQFLTSLTQSQLELFIKCSIWADAKSKWNWGEHVELGQNVEKRIDMFQMACQLAGYKTVKHSKTNEYGPWYVLSIYAFDRRKIGAGVIASKAEKRRHNGVVWCPTTKHGTWLARRNGTVFFTGNSDGEKEFRVLWNEMKRLEMPFDKPGTYNDPHGGDMHISLWNGAYQVHVKSSKYPDSLVGEGLHGVVMAEAAKIKERIWPKFIRPMLADYDGWSLQTSTPEGKNWFYRNWERGQDPTNPSWASWRAPAWMNPFVYKTPTKTGHVKYLQHLHENQTGLYRLSLEELKDEYNLTIDSEIMDLMGDLTEAAFNQEIGADFSEFVGLVFKEFDEEIHVADLEYNPSWRTYAGVDYGFTNPNVWLLIQVGPWGHVHVLDEFYQEGLTADEFASEILRRGLCPDGLISFFPDPASPGDTRILERKLRKRHHGGTGGELKHRLDAIRQGLKVPKHLRHLAYDHPERIPMLRFNRTCKEGIREMTSYRYPEKKEQSSTPSQELPMKKDDHVPEALGRFYAGLHGTPQSPRSGSRVRKSTASRGGSNQTSRRYAPTAQEARGA